MVEQWSLLAARYCSVLIVALLSLPPRSLQATVVAPRAAVAPAPVLVTASLKKDRVVAAAAALPATLAAAPAFAAQEVGTEIRAAQLHTIQNSGRCHIAVPHPT
jgi:hypothetical protein